MRKSRGRSSSSWPTRPRAGRTGAPPGASPALFLTRTLLILAASAASARASVPGAGLRIQSTAGADSNPREAIESDAARQDEFFRVLVEGSLGADHLPFAGRGGLSFRLFRESYRRQAGESRDQGEVRGRMGWLPGSRGVELNADLGGTVRDYGSARRRNYWRGWLNIATAFHLGPRGRLVTTLRNATLDFHQTARRDQTLMAFDVSYDHPLGRMARGELGMELGGVRHGRASIQWDREMEAAELGPDQRDSYRYLHLEGRWVAAQVFRLQYGIRFQGSNSIDAAFRRHEIRWLAGAPLGFGVMAQAFGNIEHTTYTDRHLDDVFIYRPEEEEAGEDNNQVAVGLSRALSRGFRLEVRHGWFKNESLLVGTYYRKRVWSGGLSWESGRLSGI